MKDSLDSWEALTKTRLDMVLHTYNPSIQEVEAEASGCQVHSWLHREFKDIKKNYTVDQGGTMCLCVLSNLVTPIKIDRFLELKHDARGKKLTSNPTIQVG